MTDGCTYDEEAFASLDSLASTLLPGNDSWPGGGSLDLGRRMVRRASDSPRLRQAIAGYLTLDDPDLHPSAGADERTAALRVLQARDPGLFAALLMSVYDAYYTHRQVLDLVDVRAGIRPGAPQPQGHLLRVEPYRDTSRVRDAGIRWRDDGEEIARSVRAAQEADPARVWTEEEIMTWPR